VLGLGAKEVAMYSFFSRRQALALLGSGLAFAARPARAATTPVVLELFTSQGCNSCPPADEYFSELISDPGIIAISYHVDYWDYLGWRDTLAAPDFSQRQYDYAKARGDMDVYTPQVVVQGGRHTTGSDRAAVKSLLREAVLSASPTLSLAHQGDELVIGIEGGPEGHGTLWLVPLAEMIEVPIKRGENAGRTLRYHNVARRLLPVGMWTGGAQRLVMPATEVLSGGATACAVLLQEDGHGPILAAARL
jgi:hypothetical protein